MFALVAVEDVHAAPETLSKPPFLPALWVLVSSFKPLFGLIVIQPKHYSVLVCQIRRAAPGPVECLGGSGASLDQCL